jgi:competence protein ComEC
MSASENRRSCVLKVSGAGGSLLLPADLDPAGEAVLASADVRAEVVVMPNHTAKGSSRPEFIAAVAPKLAIATVGYRNPFRHPRAEVVAGYLAQGSGVLRTDWTGAITLHFATNGWTAKAWRDSRRRYWHAQAGESETAVKPP